jgi:hypothetical protein
VVFGEETGSGDANSLITHTHAHTHTTPRTHTHTLSLSLSLSLSGTRSDGPAHILTTAGAGGAGESLHRMTTTSRRRMTDVTIAPSYQLGLKSPHGSPLRTNNERDDTVHSSHSAPRDRWPSSKARKSPLTSRSANKLRSYQTAEGGDAPHLTTDPPTTPTPLLHNTVAAGGGDDMCASHPGRDPGVAAAVKRARALSDLNGSQAHVLHTRTTTLAPASTSTTPLNTTHPSFHPPRSGAKGYEFALLERQCANTVRDDANTIAALETQVEEQTLAREDAEALLVREQEKVDALARDCTAKDARIAELERALEQAMHERTDRALTDARAAAPRNTINRYVGQRSRMLGGDDDGGWSGGGEDASPSAACPSSAVAQMIGVHCTDEQNAHRVRDRHAHLWDVAAKQCAPTSPSYQHSDPAEESQLWNVTARPHYQEICTDQNISRALNATYTYGNTTTTSNFDKLHLPASSPLRHATLSRPKGPARRLPSKSSSTKHGRKDAGTRTRDVTEGSARVGTPRHVGGEENTMLPGWSVHAMERAGERDVPLLTVDQIALLPSTTSPGGGLSYCAGGNTYIRRGNTVVTVFSNTPATTESAT